MVYKVPKGTELLKVNINTKIIPTFIAAHGRSLAIGKLTSSVIQGVNEMRVWEIITVKRRNDVAEATPFFRKHFYAVLLSRPIGALFTIDFTLMKEIIRTIFFYYFFWQLLISFYVLRLAFHNALFYGFPAEFRL